LAAAERDFAEAQRTTELIGIDLGVVFLKAWLAETLTGQGRFAEAEQALSEIGIGKAGDPPGPTYFAWDALALLELARGHYEEALSAALKAKTVCRRFDIRNPARVGWRSHAALALRALDRLDEARAVAAEELELARAWGAPRALGRALRVSGLVSGGEAELDLVRQAVDVLAGTPARLEYAEALVDLGAALRRTGQRIEARTPLRLAIDIAERCGAVPVVAAAHTELAAVGGRARHTALTGPDSLTPSERRVAVLAAEGSTNRQIAQRVYVTPKTVEVHLSTIYRKLGITTRTQLPAALGPASG
jgi:DNA-binding CsgD family transcriptional regulator